MLVRPSLWRWGSKMHVLASGEVPEVRQQGAWLLQVLGGDQGLSSGALPLLGQVGGAVDEADSDVAG